MKLSIAERFGIINILPKIGALSTLRSSQEVISICDVSLEEKEKFGIVIDINGSARWAKPKSDEDVVEIDINSSLYKFISDELVKLETGSKLSLEHLTLYDKFVTESSTNGTKPK